MKIFPYQRDSVGDFFPVIDLFVSRKNYIARIFALIDSGATVSIFKEDVAKQLGIDIEKGKVIHLGGVGGHIKGYLHEVKIEAAGKEFVCPIVFSREYLVSFNLLGRQEFFKRFKITFEENKNLVRVE